MKIQILNINNRHSESLSKAIRLLNLSQTDFKFNQIESGDKLEMVKKNYLSYYSFSEGKIYLIHLKKIIEKYFTEEDVLYISIISEYLIGETYENLFSEIILEEGIPINYSFITDFYVEELLKGIPFEVYFIYHLLMYSIFFASKQYIAHTETNINYCIFDYLVDKPHITNLLKTGNMCLDCQMALDDSISLSQILSINSILRIVGRIARSKEPKKLFEDYLFLSENLFKERETNKSLLQDKEIIEEIIANISKINVRLNLEINSSFQINDLKPLIAKGKFNQVFDSLISHSKDNELAENYNKIILLQSRHFRLESDIRNGIVNSENKELRQNQISKSLIDFIDTIKN